MKKNQLQDGTNLYFEHYQVVQYVANELRPQAEQEIKSKLVEILNHIDELDENGGLSVYFDEDALSLWVYPTEEWSSDDIEAKVGAFLRLRVDFKDTNAMSTLGVSCWKAPKALKAVEKAYNNQEEWLSDLSRAHKGKTYEQFYREVDWYEEFDTFEKMKTKLFEEMKNLAKGTKKLLGDKGISP